jgi:hypothetical protein
MQRQLFYIRLAYTMMVLSGFKEFNKCRLDRNAEARIMVCARAWSARHKRPGSTGAL